MCPFRRMQHKSAAVNSKLLAAASFLVAVVVLRQPATAGQPPGPTPDLPGVTKSKAEAYWIAPYVRVSEERISKHGTTSVTWFTEEGKIKRKIEVSSTQPGFVTTVSRRLPEALERNRFAPAFIQESPIETLFKASMRTGASSRAGRD